MIKARHVLAVLLLCHLAGCHAEHDGPLPPLVAHRGASDLAPENTLAAFRLAWELGADAIEGDFYLTSDGAIVSHHDNTTKKTAGVDVPIEEQTLAALRELDVGAWKDAKWRGERIPTLAEVLDTVPEGRTILIECKSDERIVPALLDTMLASALDLDQMVVICFDEAVIAAVEAERPDIKTLWLSGFDADVGGGWTPSLEEIVESARRCNADGVDLKANLDVIDESFVAAIRAAGLELHTWTVNDTGKAQRLARLGVDSITTDRPGRLRQQ